MQPRRSLRLVAGALVLTVPLLGSCGFGKATDRVYTPAAGINVRTADVDVLSALIVSAQPGSGTFIASLSNKQATDALQLTGVAGAGTWTDLKIDPADLSIDVAPRGFVNLVDQDPITVTGDMTPGQVASVTLTFDSGDAVTMDVPIVYACNAFTGLDLSKTEASVSASPSDEPSPGDVPTDGTTVSASPTASDSASPSAGPAEPYDCVGVGVQ